MGSIFSFISEYLGYIYFNTFVLYCNPSFHRREPSHLLWLSLHVCFPIWFVIFEYEVLLGRNCFFGIPSYAVDCGGILMGQFFFYFFLKLSGTTLGSVLKLIFYNLCGQYRFELQ